MSQNASSKLITRLRQMDTTRQADWDPFAATPQAEEALTDPVDAPKVETQMDAPTAFEAPHEAPQTADTKTLAATPQGPMEVHEVSPHHEGRFKMPAPIRWATVATLVWLAIIIGGVIALLRAQAVITIDATTIAAYAAGIFTPLTAFWLMALAFLRGGVLRDETERAQTSLERLLLPVDAARARARAMLTEFETQISQLNAAQETTQARAAALRDAQTDNALSLTNAANEVDVARGRVDAQMAALRELLGTLQGVTGRLESILPDATRKLTSATDVATTQAAHIQKVSTQLGEAATSMQRTTEGLSPLLAASIAKLDAAGDTVSERMSLLEIQAAAASRALDEAADKATVALDGSRAWVTEHIATIEQSVGRVESDIVRRLETLTLSLGETTAQLDKDLPSLVAALQTQMGEVDGQMRERVEEIRVAWSGLIADWDSASLSAGVRLIDAMARARNIASEAVITARSATDGIVSAVESTLKQASEKTSENIGVTLRDMRTQTAHIEELAMQASLHRAAMATALEDKVHDDLAKLSEQLIDQLNAYAVDISRIYSGDVTEQELTAYTRGDSGLFARRFAKGISNVGASVSASKLHSKIAERFTTEHEFADMVRRYITGFESLLKLSEQTTEKSSLTVALLTSDLGKMYLALARSVGRFEAV